MSSSTVSITGNRPNPSLRSRPTLTADKKDITGTDETDHSPVKNPTHSTEPLLETSKDTLQTKNPLPTTSTTKLRKRTLVKKGSAPSPSWKTAARVIFKNLGVLLVLLGLIHMVRRLGFGFNQGAGVGFDSVSGEDYERRIAQVEAFLKTTTKMIQVQVDVVDRKIESEVKGLRSELSKRIDDQRAVVGEKFGEFDQRVGSVEKVVTGVEWVSKHEFDKFVEEFGKRGDGEVKLDEIRRFAREIVEKEIGKHAADGLGRVDYAVASGGAKVLRHSEAFTSASRVMGWFSGNVRSDAMKVLQPSFGQPGECFPLKGDNGFVDVKLRTAIVPEAVTLEHVSKSVAFDISSAPKHCKVWGWLQNDDDSQKEHLLTEFTYDLEKSIAQTFNVMDMKSEDPIVIDTIRLELMSNHGSPTHTCIYRVRVHGHQPNDS